MDLSKSEITRYSRHILLDEIGMSGQLRLKRSKVLVVGGGGLGSPALLYLAAAGVGTLGIAEFDRVDLSNLQRQVLFSSQDLGQPKGEAARQRLLAANPHLYICNEPRISAENAGELVRCYDLVVDGCDRLATRYLLADACAAAGRPYIYGSVYRFEGQVAVFAPPKSPCFRCAFPRSPAHAPSCAENGVLGVVPGVIGSLQATEALKWILGIGEPLVGRLLVYSALTMGFEFLQIPQAVDCPGCSENSSVVHQLPAQKNQGEEALVPSLSPQQLQHELNTAMPPLLLDVRTTGEREICVIEPSLHLPLAKLHRSFGELEPQRSLVVYCKSGVRGNEACRLLRDAGFAHVRNLEGGILAWLADIDPRQSAY